MTVVKLPENEVPLAPSGHWNTPTRRVLEILLRKANVSAVVGEALYAAATPEEAQAILELVPGVNVQPFGEGLSSISALDPDNNHFIVGDGTEWTAESPADARTSMDAQQHAADLDSLSGFGIATGIPCRTGDGTWSLRTLVAPAAGITVTNGGGVAGNITLVLANDLAALEGLGSTGFAARTSANTWAQRSIAVGTRLSITNPAGIAGDPTISISNTNLIAIADVTSAADKLFYFTGAGTGAVTDFVANGRTLVSHTFAQMRADLDLEAGTDFYSITAADAAFQPKDADLTTLATTYATGSFTPTVALATAGSSSVVYTVQTGNYIRIGALVVADFALSFQLTIGTGSGNLEIRSLPVTVATGMGGIVRNMSANLTFPAGQTFMAALPVAAGTTALLRMMGSNIAAVLVQSTHITSGATVTIAGTLFYLA